MISASIKDGKTGDSVKVTHEGAITAVIHPHPPISETVFPLPFSQFFTDNGGSSGSKDMIVNGGTTPVDFYVEASQDYTLFIKSITIQLSDPGARLDRFGALTALSNGIRFSYVEQDIGELVISEAMQTNLDLFRDATGGKDFGDGTGAWKADISGGTGEDTYFPELDLSERFGLQWGLRLVKGTTDRLVFRVQDNLAGLSVFNIKAYGIRL